MQFMREPVTKFYEKNIVNFSWSKILASRSRKYYYFFMVEISTKKKLL